MANEFKVRKGLIVNGSGSTILDIQGSQGQLFSVTDQLSGSLFSVNDISGVPVLEAFSDSTVKIGQYLAEAIIVSGSTARITGSMALSGFSTGSVLFAGTGGAISQNNSNFFWDNANSRLGIGTNAPATTLTVNASVLIGTTLLSANTAAFPLQINLNNIGSNVGAILRNQSSTGYTSFRFYNDQNLGTRALEFGYVGSAYSGAVLTGGVTGESAYVVSTGAYALQFGTNNAFRGMFSANGNFILNSTTDNGERLQVSGSSRFGGNMIISGSGNTSATNALSIFNSNNNSLLSVRNDGYVTIHAVNSVSTILFDSVSSQLSRSTSGTNGLGLYGPNNAHHSLTISSFNSNNYDNGALSSLNFSGNFVPSSGATAFSYMLINGTINQTGTSANIVRGLYVNPTLTSATNFRAIEWSNNASGSTSWGLYGAGSAPNYLAGNLLINTLSDDGNKLNVGGSIKLTGAITMADNQNFNLSPRSVLVDNGGRASFTLNQGGNSLSYALTLTANGFFSATTGTGGHLRITGDINPPSGTGIFNMLLLQSTVSQSSATGITRGLYINPTLTSAWDFRSIEWSNNASAVSGSWGLYGTGTAPNLLNGRLIVNSSITSSQLLISGSGSQRLTVQGSGSSILTVDGALGRLFSVDDAASGSLFSVNTISGLPIMEAFSDNTVRIGQFGQKALFVSQSRVGIGKEDSLNATLDVSGSMALTGSFNHQGNYTTNGTITAQTLVISTISSSVLYSSGSNVFGNDLSNTQVFTGSVSITGSLTSAGNVIITGSSTFNGDVVIRGSGTTSATTGFTLLKSNGGSTFAIRNDGFGIIYGNYQITSSLPYLQLTPTSWGSFYIQSGVNILANAAGDYTNFQNPLAKGFVFTQNATASLLIAPTTNNISIGTSSDLGVRLGVVGDTILRGSGSTSATNALIVQNSGSTQLLRVSNDGNVAIGFTGSLVYKLELGEGNFRISNPGLTQQLVLGYSGGQFNFVGTATNTPLQFLINSSAAAILTTNRNFLLGSTTDDTINRLQVSGSSRFTGNMVISGSGNTSATNALSIVNSSNLNILRVLNDGSIYITAQTNTEDNNVLLNINRPNGGKIITFRDRASIEIGNNNFIYPTAGDANATISRSANGLFLGQIEGTTTTADVFNISLGRPSNINNQPTAGTSGGLAQVIGQFNPTSGTAVFSAFRIGATINQTGGANGITRGLYINPTLTAAADFRAIEWSNNAATAPSASWGLYGAGSAPNYLSGNLNIGTTLTGSSILNVVGSSTLNGNVLTGNQIIVGGASATAGILNFFNGNVGIARTGASGLDFRVGSNTVAATIFSTANVLVQAGGSHTDDGINRLQVTGNARISQALTASQALISGSGTQRLVVVGSGSAQPLFTVQGSQGELFSIVDSLSGSLFSVNDQSGLPIMEVFSDNTILMGNYLDPMLLTTTKTGSAAGINTIYSLPTSSYDAVYIDYTIRSGSNARAGNFMAMWSGTSVNFTDNSITEFGSTSTFTFGAHVSGANMVVTGSAPTAGWTIKTIIKAI